MYARRVIRDGKLRMTWAKPPDEARAMGIQTGGTRGGVLESARIEEPDSLRLRHREWLMPSRTQDDITAMAVNTALRVFRPYASSGVMPPQSQQRCD